jgi:hypothetical protein
MKALQGFKTSYSTKLSPAEKEAIDEVARRLRRLDNQLGQLIGLNNRVMKRRLPETEFDPDTDTVTYRIGELEQKIKLKRADPKVPITMRRLTEGGAYKAKPPDTKQQGVNERDELKFEGLLEDYYNNAHRVLKLVKALPGLRKFECREITIVRNKLVEHPHAGEVYSFGFGATGPTIRPMHKPDREWHDEGLVHNTETFVRRLAAALKTR